MRRANLTVENGWRGPIPEIARMAAITPRGSRAAIYIPRSELIALPEVGQTLEHDGATLTVSAVATDAAGHTISCTRNTNNA